MRIQAAVPLIPLVLFVCGCDVVLRPATRQITDLHLSSVTLGTGASATLESGPGTYTTYYGTIHAGITIEKYYEINKNPENYGSDTTGQLVQYGGLPAEDQPIGMVINFNDGPSRTNAFIVIRVGAMVDGIPGTYQDTVERTIFLSEFDLDSTETIIIELPNCQGSVILRFSADTEWVIG